MRRRRRAEVLSAFFDPPPDVAACAAILRAVAAAAAAPPPPPPPPASASPLNAFASAFAAALPPLPPPPDTQLFCVRADASWPSLGFVADDTEAGGPAEAAACDGDACAQDGDDSDGEWWQAAELAADPQALWGGTETAAPEEGASRYAGYARRDADDDADADDAGAAAADAAVAGLAARFPTLEPATICGVLLSLGCDVAAAEAALAELAAAPPPPPPPPPPLDDARSFPSLGGPAAPRPAAAASWHAEPAGVAHRASGKRQTQRCASACVY